MVEDLRSLLREFAGRKPRPTAMILDSRTLQSTPESGSRAGYDGAKRRKGSKMHAAVDTLGHLLALHVTACRRATSIFCGPYFNFTGDYYGTLISGRGSIKRQVSASYCFYVSAANRIEAIGSGSI
jgi:hypothetical protein